MNYFFVLGNNPTLSIAEISAFFPNISGKIAENQIFLLNLKNSIDAQKTMHCLGGTIKIGENLSIIKSFNERNLAQEIAKILATNKDYSGKINYGFSNYTEKKINQKVLGMEIKKHLKELGANCRWVTSRDKILSSVVVEQNKLTDHGAEIIFIKCGKDYFLGKTLAVQPFKELSFRDYGRPGRDDQSGMLPPKLAQIMINLSQADKNDIILDPFCGSGTILTEALLMGYNNIIGSDLSGRAVSDTKKNISWIKDNFTLMGDIPEVYELSATELTKKIKPKSISAIITEPYLGPQRGYHDFQDTIKNLEKLYSDSLKEFKKILKPDGVVIMIWPVFMKKYEQNPINPNYNDFNIVNPISNKIENYQSLRLTKRQTIIYGRPDQKVWREIVILKLKS